jgi:transposase
MSTINYELSELIFNKETHPIVRRKALVIALKNADIKHEQITQIVPVSKRRITDYVKEFREKGIEGMSQYKPYKPKSELENYTELIKEDFEKNLPATATEASDRIEKLTGIKRSPTQVRNFMHKIGLKHLKVGHIPAKANPQAQEKFLEEEMKPRLEEAKNGDRVVLFCDAAHFVLHAFLGMLWCFVRQFVPSPSGRQRLNVLGAYNALNQDLITVINTTYITATTICELLIKVKEKYGNIPITLILDNARYQKCDIVFESAKGLNIELLYLPTYSPNLNLIERLWRFVKKDCLYSKYHKSFKEFRAAIENCLSEVSTTKKSKVKSLITLNFQLFDKETKIA